MDLFPEQILGFERQGQKKGSKVYLYEMILFRSQGQGVIVCGMRIRNLVT